MLRRDPGPARMYPIPYLDLPPLGAAAGTVQLPGSKSISNRLLLLAGLSEGVTTLVDLLDSDDTRVMLDALAMVLGGVLAYFALSSAMDWIPSLLGFAAASMLYVAVADLIPGLHKRTELKATVQQVLLITLGIASIAIVRALVGE